VEQLRVVLHDDGVPSLCVGHTGGGHQARNRATAESDSRNGDRDAGEQRTIYAVMDDPSNSECWSRWCRCRTRRRGGSWRRRRQWCWRTERCG
jgi:hypothetical protein